MNFSKVPSVEHAYVDRRQFIAGLGAAVSVASAAAKMPLTPSLPGSDWHLGPFRRLSAEPVMGPDPNPVFFCPMRKQSIHWLAAHRFNPAAVVKDDHLWVLFRAEDKTGLMQIGGHTSRLGLAWSDDGIHFATLPEPVLYPDEDDQKSAEWDGGCEDPRLCEGPDGTYVVTYTQWNHRVTCLGLATSTDLVHWKKHGQAFAGTAYEKMRTKSAAIIQKIEGGRMKAARIGGRYWMVFGEGSIHLAHSTDLVHWAPVEEASGRLHVLLGPRPFHFDSAIAEVGPPPMLTDKGIVVLYNGKNSDKEDDRVPTIGAGAYSGGQALLDSADPKRLLARDNTPFIQPELPWEKSGQYVAGTTFIEGLSYFRSRLFLYYGSADTYIGVAASEAIPAPKRD